MKRAISLCIASCAMPLLVAATPPVSPFDRFVGSWNCTSANGPIGEMTFSIRHNTLVLHANWNSGGGKSGADHIFTVDRDGSWTTTESNAAKSVTFKGDSPGFDADTITFTGTDLVGDRSWPQLEKFRFTSTDAFQHIWYGKSDSGQWQPNAYQECTKVST